MFFQTTDRTIVIFGGGETAAQKARLARKTDAQIVLIAPDLNPELQELVSGGHAEHLTTPPRHLGDAALSFVATGCPGADASLHAVAKTWGAPVNVVDQPHLCDILTPSIVDRDPVIVAIGTEGTAPVLGRAIKTQIESLLPRRLGHLAALAGRLRQSVARSVSRSERRAFWAWVFKDAPYRAHVAGQETAAEAMIEAAIAAGAAPETHRDTRLSLVRCADGQSDLLTLRAVERLQEADLVVFDTGTDPAILELARRDAKRLPLEAGLAHNLPALLHHAQTIARGCHDGSQIVFVVQPTASFEAADLAPAARGHRMEVLPMAQVTATDGPPKRWPVAV